jgi:hypothetical protein
MAVVLESEDGENLIVIGKGWTASFLENKWQSGIAFDSYELSDMYRLPIDSPVAGAAIRQAKVALCEK